MHRSHKTVLYLLLVLMGFAWAGNLVLIKVALNELPPLALLLLRVWIATSVLLVAYFVKGKHRESRLVLVEWKTLAFLGLLGITLNQLGVVMGLRYTTVGHSTLLFGLAPIFILWLAVCLRMERITAGKVLGLSMAFVGILLLVSEQGFTANDSTSLGDLITLVGVICFASYTVLGKRVSGQYDTLTFMTSTYVVGALLLLPLCGWQLLEVDWALVTWRGWSATFYTGTLGSVLTFSIYYYCLKHMDASRVAVFTYLEPVLAIGLAFVVLGEKPTWYLVSGGVLILLGVYSAERGSRSVSSVPVTTSVTTSVTVSAPLPIKNTI